MIFFSPSVLVNNTLLYCAVHHLVYVCYNSYLSPWIRRHQCWKVERLFEFCSWYLAWQREREREMLRLRLLSCLLVLSGTSRGSNSPHHEPTDYCSLLGEDDINGLKHGFLAGNNVLLLHFIYISETPQTRSISISQSERELRLNKWKWEFYHIIITYLKSWFSGLESWLVWLCQ